MKVCTDACILGGFAAGLISKKQSNVKNILDIGTGTGLLSLMLAQKTTALIDTVEIEPHAFQQARENIEQSPWKGKIQSFRDDITQFKSDYKYDFIITNPPFFENELKAPNEKKNAARHDTTLTLKALLQVIDFHLSDAGLFIILLPQQRFDYFETEALKHKFFPSDKLCIRQTPQHDFFRVVAVFSRTLSEREVHEMDIKNEAGDYTKEFVGLLKDYYLNL